MSCSADREVRFYFAAVVSLASKPFAKEFPPGKIAFLHVFLFSIFKKQYTPNESATGEKTA
jgi:hypothetical protein